MLRTKEKVEFLYLELRVFPQHANAYYVAGPRCLDMVCIYATRE